MGRLLWRLVGVLLVVWLTMGATHAKEPVVRASARLGVSAVRPGDRFEVLVVLDIREGYHINPDKPKLDFQLPTVVKLQPSPGLVFEAPRFPPGEQIKMAVSPEPVPVLSKRVVVRIFGQAAAGLAAAGSLQIPVTVDYQACNETSCLAPTKVEALLVVPLAGPGAPVTPQSDLPSLPSSGTEAPAPATPATSSGKAPQAAAPPTSVPPGGVSPLGGSSPGAPSPVPPPDARAIATALLSALLGGLLLNIMPCVFPVLSIKVAGVVEHAHASGTPPWKHAAAFTAGVLVFCWGLAGALMGLRAAGEQAGWGFQLQSPLFVAAMALLLFVLALNLFGVFEVGMAATRLGGVETGGGLLGSFGSGALTTLVATPCSAPFMGSAVGMALNQPGWYTFPIFTLLGIGIALPYDVLVCVPALVRRLPRPGPWMVTFKQLLAFPMLAAVVWLAWVLGVQRGVDGMAALLACTVGVGLGLWGYGATQVSLRAGAALGRVISLALVVTAVAWLGSTLSRPAARHLAWEPYSPEAVQRARDAGRTVFIDFTAAWCTTCQANERLVLARTEIIEAFAAKQVVALRADFSSQDPVIAAALASYGRSAVPVYVVYTPTRPGPQVLPDVLTPSVVLEAVGAGGVAR